MSEKYRGEVTRTENTSYFIFKGNKHICTFKNDELKNRQVLDKIVALLNKLTEDNGNDYEVSFMDKE